MTAQVSSLDREFVASFRSDCLHLILLPTEQCNFRCTYCYEDFAIGRMNPDVVRGVKNLIDRRVESLTSLQVSWFGGEPMLARPIVEDVAGHAQRAAERRSDLRYESDMTTNGYMLDGTTIERLAALGVHAYQISMDGPQELHDRTRIRADGRGSYNRIWHNLLSIRESSANVKVLLRVHLTPQNLPVMDGFVTLVRDTFLHDSRFSVYLKNVVPLGGPNDATMEFLGDEDRERIDALRQLVLGGSGDGGRLFQPEEVCYAARANSLLVRADGRLGKCTVALTDPANTIGRLLPDGSIHIDNPRLRLWLQGWESGDQELIACPYEGFTRAEQPLLQITPRPPNAGGGGSRVEVGFGVAGP